MNPDYLYEMAQTVKLELSNERGMVIGRAQFIDKSNQYLVRYLAADGRQVEAWWDEAAIVAA